MVRWYRFNASGMDRECEKPLIRILLCHCCCQDNRSLFLSNVNRGNTALDWPYLVHPVSLVRLTSSKLMISFGASPWPLLETQTTLVFPGCSFAVERRRGSNSLVKTKCPTTLVPYSERCLGVVYPLHFVTLWSFSVLCSIHHAADCQYCLSLILPTVE